jgi:hypothetical protein
MTRICQTTYIEGPESTPPIIPPLQATITHHSVDNHGGLSTVHVLGNLGEHQQAIQNAEPWMTENNTALARIILAIPSHQLHLVKQVQYGQTSKQFMFSVPTLKLLCNMLPLSNVKLWPTIVNPT